MIRLHTRVLLISLFVHLSRQLHVSQSISVKVHIPSWYSVPSVSIFRETLKQQHVHGALKDEHRRAWIMYIFNTWHFRASALWPYLFQADLEPLKMDVRSYCKISQTFLSLDCAEIRDQVRTTLEVVFHTHHFYFLVIFLMAFKSLHLQAFELLCDLLLLYSPSSASSTPALQTLVYLPSHSLRCDMAGFVMDYIISDADGSDLDGQYLFCVTFFLMKFGLFSRSCCTLSWQCSFALPLGILS